MFKFIGYFLAVVSTLIITITGFTLLLYPILKAMDGKWYEPLAGVICVLAGLLIPALLPKLPHKDDFKEEQ